MNFAAIVWPIKLAGVLPHTIELGFPENRSFWILFKACIQPPNAILKEIEFTLELFLWRISQAEIMRKQDQVQDLVRSQEPQSWNILELGNELSLKR